MRSLRLPRSRTRGRSSIRAQRTTKYRSRRPDAAVYRGRADIGKFWDEWHELWNLEIEPSEIRDLGDAVLVRAVLRTQGKSSGVEVERSIGYVFQFEDGLVRRATAYMTPQEALKAAGLRE